MRTTEELTRAPRLLPLYGKAVLPKPGPRGEPGLPERRLVLPDVAPDHARQRRYAELCGFTDATRLPVTYPHIVAFPLSMALMAARDFPFPLLGLVHLANRVEQLRPVGPRERLTYAVETGGTAPHPKGTAFTVHAQARGGGEPVWRSTSTYLCRGAGDGGVSEAARKASGLTAAGRSECWNLPGSLGRSYAAVSGDRNPIHLHPLTARLFGFPRAIAHGMWTKARCLAALSDRLPDACAVEVTFRAPVPLPTAVRFRAARSDGEGLAFDLRSGDLSREHLRGNVSALA